VSAPQCASGEVPAKAAAAEAGGAGTVVLIEDDVNVANAWGLLLEAEGYRVATAKSAPEANAIIAHLDDALAAYFRFPLARRLNRR
jgi:hypothetical protein